MYNSLTFMHKYFVARISDLVKTITILSFMSPIKVNVNINSCVDSVNVTKHNYFSFFDDFNDYVSKQLTERSRIIYFVETSTNKSQKSKH